MKDKVLVMNGNELYYILSEPLRVGPSDEEFEYFIYVKTDREHAVVTFDMERVQENGIVFDTEDDANDHIDKNA